MIFDTAVVRFLEDRVNVEARKWTVPTSLSSKLRYATPPIGAAFPFVSSL